MDQTDSLEDWVAIKENPFLNKSEAVRLEILVAWNDVDGHIAITCREHSRVASDSETLGQSAAFTFHEILAIHNQLSLVHPSLGPYLPQLPYEPRGLWAYIASPTGPPDDSICHEIRCYLHVALEICGQKLLLSTLFEEHTYEEYFEKVSELKRRSYDDAVTNAEDELKNVLFLREGSINMLDMLEVYKHEDEALFKYNVAFAELYNFLLQPFLDMREVSFRKLQDAKQGLQNPNLGERRKKECADTFWEWQESYVHALDRIQELYIQYYTKTVALYEARRSRMMEDQERFGKYTFEMTSLERLNRTCEDLGLEKLQLLQATKKQYEHQRDKKKQEIASLVERPGGIRVELEQLEQCVYEWQVKVINIDMQIMDGEEALLKTQIKAIKDLETVEDNTIHFYDAVEEVDELSGEEGERDGRKEGGRVQALRSKLSVIYRRRALLRNKKKSLLASQVSKKLKKIEAEERFKQHHSIQIRREDQQEEMEKKKKKKQKAASATLR